ncbi:MAG: metallophosphoesterase [Proteobacteria bacterium]|nr:metallophosphoesterase [Pseudomonadota bacterium]
MHHWFRRFFALTTLLLIADLSHAAVAPTPAESEFHFVVLGDSQFDDPTVFNRQVDDAARLRPAFVIQVGDMIDGYSDDLNHIREEWNRFHGQIAPLKQIPFMPVPGNHDLYGATRKADQALIDAYTDTWGAKLYYHFVYANSLFLVLNTDGLNAESRIDDVQIRWLTQQLADNQSEHIFVFMHRPPASLANADGLHELLKRYPVRYVFYGHHHHYHFSERDGIKYVMTNASGDTGAAYDEVGGFDHLIQVAVRDSEVVIAVIKADSMVPENAVLPADNYDLFALTRSMAPGEVTLQGEASPYQAVIRFQNPTDRPIRLEVSCSSADNRWQIEPRRIDALDLPAKGETQLDLKFSTTPDRPPESMPVCRVELPFLTGQGRWIRHSMEVRLVYPE